MRNLFIASLLLFFAACNTSTENNTTADESNADVEYFGEKITKTGAIPSEDFMNSFEGKDSIRIKMSGTIEKVCQKKGCWMTMSIGDDESLFIKFKDYGFFVPLNADGRDAVIEGWAYREEQSVEELKHYAFDEGKTDEEIALITEPEVTYTFMANGVIIE